MSDKPPLGLRPRWLVLSDRADEIKAAIQRYETLGLPRPFDWLIELKEIERQQVIYPPTPTAEPTPEPTPAAPKPEPEKATRGFLFYSSVIINGNNNAGIYDYAIATDYTAWHRLVLRGDSQADVPWRQIRPLPPTRRGVTSQ
jgi:hypothetical protein